MFEMFTGFRYDIPLCCVMWFECVWRTLRKDIPEYSVKMPDLTGNDGVVLCPECLEARIRYSRTDTAHAYYLKRLDRVGNDY